MPVFKVYFKIIQKNLPQMLIYLVIFLAISILLINVGVSKPTTSFTASKTKIAFINHDENSEFIKGFHTYLSNNATLVEIEDTTEKLQDALFFRNIEYIIRIPKGFTQSFLNGQNILIEKTTVPDSISSYYIDMMVDKYFNTARLYVNNMKDINQTQLVSYIDNDLALKTKVHVNAYGTKTSNTNNSMFYFNYFAYSLFAIIILGVTSFIMVFNDPELKKRNLSSPLPTKSMNVQVIFANLMFSLVTWAIMVCGAFIIFGRSIINYNTVYFIINSLFFTLVCLSISFFVGNIIKSRNAQSAIVNVLSLGLSFISGVFVPQILLGKTVLKIANFTPTYWYIKANNDINNIISFDTNNTLPIIYAMLIQFGFAVVILAVSLVVIKQKKVSNS